MDYDIESAVYVLGTAFVYCFPTFIALARGHPNCVPITVVNLSLGWTGHRLGGRVGLVVKGSPESTQILTECNGLMPRIHNIWNS